MKRAALVEIGERIKAARKELNIQQKEMAAVLDVSSSHLSEIEAGKSNPSTEFYLKLSQMYNVSIEYLFHGRGGMFYDENGIASEKTFDFDSDVDDISKLNWLLNNSGYVRVSVLGFVSKLVLEEGELIKESIKKTRGR